MDHNRSAVEVRRRSRTRVCLPAAGIALAAALSACGSADDPAAERADHFYAALADGDGAAACTDLAPEARSSLEQQEGKPCAKAIVDQDLPEATGRPDVRIYGSMAQVAFLGETAFLSRFADGWRLTAVGCTRGADRDQPYDCAIEAG